MDKELKIHSVSSSCYGTHTYKCTLKGNWKLKDLINALEGKNGNYRGKIDNERKNEDGTRTATVSIQLKY